MKGENIRRMNQTQFFDRLIDRMDKMIVAMNKLSKTLEAMQKVEFNKAMTISVTDKNGDPVVLHKHAENKNE
jgi:hypothetical protein